MFTVLDLRRIISTESRNIHANSNHTAQIKTIN